MLIFSFLKILTFSVFCGVPIRSLGLDHELPTGDLPLDNQGGNGFQYNEPEFPTAAPKPAIQWDFSTCRQKNATLYWMTENRYIRFFRIEHTVHPALMYTDFIVMNDTIRAFAYDQKKRRMLFVPNLRPTEIISFSDINARMESFENKRDREFDEIVVDALTGNIYFAEHGFGIGVCTPTMSHCKMLVPARLQEHKFFSLTVHPRRGAMFWIQIDGYNQVIKVAGMDGANVRQLGNFSEPHSIALDKDSCGHEWLYVADNSTNTYKVNLETLEQEIFVDIPLSGLFYFNCRLFYTQVVKVPTSRFGSVNQTRLEVYSFKSDKEPKTATSLVTNLTSLDVRFAIDTDVHFHHKNPCKLLRCPKDYLCLLVENLDLDHIAAPAKCVFSQSMLMVNKEVEVQMTEEDMAELQAEVADEEEEEANNKRKKGININAGWVVSGVLGFVLSVLILYIVFKQRCDPVIKRHLALPFLISSSLSSPNSSVGQNAAITGDEYEMTEGEEEEEAEKDAFDDFDRATDSTTLLRQDGENSVIRTSTV